MIKDFPKSLLFPTILFILYCGIFSYSNLIGVDMMEARNFVAAREMVENGNWLIPTMNGELRLAKPPLPTWLTAVAMKFAGSDKNLAANRLPAGLAALLLLIFLYRFTLLYAGTKQASVATVLLLSTSYMFMYMSRRGTWDMFSHAFVMAAIWALFTAVHSGKNETGYFVAAGIFLGLSFMSKGPVSLYSLFLPFLLSELLGNDRRNYFQHWKMISMSALIALLVSISWPAYLYFSVPEDISKVAMTEIDSWGNAHVKPIYWYLQFPATIGIWMFFLLPALWVPHSKLVAEKGFPVQKAVIWLLLALILLTIIPEKKDRYLLPLTIPMAILLGGYVTGLVNSQSKTGGSSIILRLYGFLFYIFLLATTATGIYYCSQYGSDWYIMFVSLASLVMLVTSCMFRNKGQQPHLLYIVLSFALLTQPAGLLASRLTKPDNFMEMQKLRSSPRLSNYRIYSDNYEIKVIWAAGRRIYEWNYAKPPALEKDEKILLLTRDEKQANAFAKANSDYLMVPENEISSGTWHLFIVSRKSANEALTGN